MNSTISAMHRPLSSNTVEPEIRLSIEELLTDYCHRLDDGDVDKWTSFFAEDATYKITTLENVKRGYPLGIMYCDGRGMMEDRIKALKTANIFEEHVYCHIISRPEIRKEDGDIYSVRTNFSIFRTMYTGASETFATGRYQDMIRCTPSEALFLEKQVIVDSRRIDTLLVLPI